MIRNAVKKDIPKIYDLLLQVDLVHHNGRPDIFKIGAKYSKEQLENMLSDELNPILVCVDENDDVMGYCFCNFICHKNNSVLTDIKTLYIDDICVDQTLRGKGVGTKLFNGAKDLAKSNNCHNLTLNVWSCNGSAMEFYKAMGLVPQKVVMEKIL